MIGAGVDRVKNRDRIAATRSSLYFGTLAFVLPARPTHLVFKVGLSTLRRSFNLLLRHGKLFGNPHINFAWFGGRSGVAKPVDDRLDVLDKFRAFRTWHYRSLSLKPMKERSSASNDQKIAVNSSRYRASIAN